MYISLPRIHKLSDVSNTLLSIPYHSFSIWQLLLHWYHPVVCMWHKHYAGEVSLLWFHHFCLSAKWQNPYQKAYKYIYKVILYAWKEHESLSPCADSRANIDYEPPTAVSSVLATRSWAIHQARIGTGRVVPYNGRNSEKMLDKNEFPVAAYTWHWRTDMIIAWVRHENASPCTGNRVNANYERIVLWAGYQLRTWARGFHKHLFATYCSIQFANHSAMAHPSKKTKLAN